MGINMAKFQDIFVTKICDNSKKTIWVKTYQ
jgi:hypothetical protein